MATNASVVGGLGTLLVSLMVMFFDLPNIILPNRWTGAVQAEKVPSEGKDGPIRARAKIADVGKGKRLTLQFDFRVDERE